MIVVVTAEAESDLEQIATHIAEQSVEIALNFVQELREKCESLADAPRGYPLVTPKFSRRIRRLGRVCGSWMMVVKKYGEAVSQQRIVGNSGLKESFLHIARQVRPKPERRVTQQQLKLLGQIIHMPPLAYDGGLLPTHVSQLSRGIAISQISDLT